MSLLDLVLLQVPCECVSQMVTEGMGDAYLRLKLKDQARALDMITGDAQLAGLRQLRAPLVDLEVRGMPALQYFGTLVWQDAIEAYAQSAHPHLSLRLAPSTSPQS